MSKTKWKDILALVTITLFIVLFTFPEVSPAYSPGLDTSYVWALNWLFVHDYSTLTQLIYPFGPLAFLRIPTYEGGNLIMYLAFLFLLKVALVVLGVMAVNAYARTESVEHGKDRFAQWFIPSVFLAGASYFANIDGLVVINCLFLVLIAIHERKMWPMVTASVLSVLSLFIKVSIGVNAISVVSVAILLNFLKNRNLKTFLMQVGAFLVVVVLMSFLVLHKPQVIGRYLYGVFHLVFGYGSLSISYSDHLLWIFLFAATILSAYFVCGSESAKQACVIMFLPIFAFWKHGILREDCWHYFGMVNFVIVFWMALSLLETTGRRKYVLLLGCVSVMSLLLNAKEMDGFEARNQRTFCGVVNFTEPFFHYREFVSEARTDTECALRQKQLPDTMSGIIGKATVDIYPFEFSYAAQNKLNWKPRAALGSALSPWLETKSMQNFSSGADAVRFVILHLQDDAYGGMSTTIDSHYFLNEEPGVMMNLLRYYHVASVSDHLMLLEHSGGDALGKLIEDEAGEVGWSQWVEVPHGEGEIVRAKVTSKKTLVGRLRAFFYKDVEYWVDYQTADGNVYTYRYDPVFAEEGLWCSPFVRFPNGEQVEPDVVRIRFFASKPSCVKPELKLSFEHIEIKDKGQPFVSKPVEQRQ